MAKSDDILKKYGITQVTGSESGNTAKSTTSSTSKTAKSSNSKATKSSVEGSKKSNYTSTGSTKADEILSKYGITQVRRSNFTSAQNWAEGSKKLLSDVQNYFGEWRSKDDSEYRRYQNLIHSYLSQADDWRAQYSGDKDAITSLDSIVSALNEASSYASQNRDYYAQWDTIEDYTAYLDWQKDYDEKSKYDLDAGQKEIDALKEELRKLKQTSPASSAYLTGNTMVNGRPYAVGQQVQNEVTPTDSKIGELERLISQKQQYLNQAKHIQKGITLAGVVNNADFKDNSGYVSTYDDGAWSKLTSSYGLGYKDLTYEYINNQNGIRDEIKSKHRAYDKNDDESVYEANGYDKLTENEIAIYNYYYAKEGKEKAQEYLDSIQESLNHRKAIDIYGGLEDHTALELVFGVEAGLDQFKSGLGNLFNTKDDYIAQTATQMASGMVREDLADDGFKLPSWLGGASIGQVGYDAITTTANMAPSIITSMALGALNPTAGSWAGSTLLGASAAGNAYQEALNEGFDKGQARAYSILVGGSEIVMERVLGGISAFGGNTIGKTLTSNLSNADTALKMIAKKLGGSIVSEFSEEYLQEVLTPWFQNIALDTDKEVKLFSAEALYAGLLGALTAGVLEGPTAIGGEVRTYNTGRQLQNAGVSAESLAEIGNKFSADTVAYQLAGKVNEKTGAYTMGRLFNEIGATLTEQNVNDITNALVAKGMDEATARKNAKAMAMVVEGGNLTDLQVAIIESNNVLAEAVRTTIIDSNATWFQRTKGYNEALMALAKEKTAPKTATADTTQTSEENAPNIDNVDAQNEDGSEAVSEADTGPMKVKSISSIKDGQVTVKLEDGSEVNLKEADLDPDDGVRIETIASIEGISSEDANLIMNTLKADPGASAQFDSLGAKEAYKYGFYGFSQDHIAKHGVFANSLTKTQRNDIYEIGRSARQRQVEKETPKKAVAKSATTGIYFDAGGGNVVAFREGQYEALNDFQNAGVKAAMVLRKLGIGGDIYFFESYRNEQGRLVYKDENGVERPADNGWYSKKDGSIHIDLKAGKDGHGFVMFTLAHELTHFIEQWSPQKYKVLADFLIKEYEKGKSMDEIVRAKQKRLSELCGEKVSYKEAYSEVIADSMEAMLADGNVLDKLIKLKQTDNSLFMKMKQFFDNLVAKIRRAYEGQIPDSKEGEAVLNMKEALEEIQNLFADALVDASENYQSSLTPGQEGTIVNQNGDTVAHATADGTIQLSIRTYDEDGRKAFRDYLNKCVKSKKLTKAEMQDMLDGIEEIYDVCKEFKDKYAPFSSWSDAAVVRDTHGKPVFSVVTPNGDYKMNLDFSLVCKKRRTLDAVFNEMTKRGIIDDFELGQKSVVKINEIIRKYGLETACALCFVDAKRFRQASMADQFTSLYNELVESLVPEDQNGSIDHFNFSGYETIKKVEGGIDTWENSKLDFSHLDHVLKTYGDGTVEYKAAKYIKTHPEGRKLLLRGDFMSSQGFDAVKTQNQDILKLYNSKKGTGGPKAAFGDVQYMNEVIQKARWWTPKKAYEVGGIRIQSFSDYVPRMVFDYVQMIYDLAATKLPAHAYTKEALFVKQFGLTGVKINMSLIPAIVEGGIAPGLDANGNYVWAGESFDFETAKQIQNTEGYTENCGTICVGVSDRHIRKLLSDPDIRMVIPYHKSGLNPIVAHMNKIAEFTDYTNKQNTTVKETGAKAEKNFDFNKALHDMGKNADPRAVIQQYFDWCDDNGYDPKFAEFRDHPNYYKLIEDFTLYDKDGNYVPQREVRAVFPKEGSAFGSMKDLIKEGLEEDAVIEGKRDSSLKAIVDEIQETLPRTEAEIAEEQVEQADRDLESDVQHSIREGMTDEERYAELKDKKIVIKGDEKSAEYVGEIESLSALNKKAKSKAEKIIIPLAQKLGILGKTMTAKDVDVEFIFSKNKGLPESISKQLRYGGNYVDFAKTLMNLDKVIDSAVLIEVHGDKYKGTSRENENLQAVYVLFSAFRDGKNIIPVQMEIKKSSDVGGRLYLTVALTKIEADVMGSTLGENQTHSLLPASEYSLAEIFRKINPQDAHFLKYLPDGFLSDEQIAAKIAAIEADRKRIEGYGRQYSVRDTESVSNRSLLANAFEGVAQNDIERNKVQEYKSKIDLINAEERKLTELNKKIKELSFAKGPRDKKKISDLRFEAQQAANRINTYDRQLLRLEASKPLQDVLTREKKLAYKRAEQKGKEALAEYKLKAEKKQTETAERYRESRKKAVTKARETAEKRDARAKLQKIVLDTVKWISYPAKTDVKCPDLLKKPYEEFLKSIDMSSERLAKGGDPTKNDLRLANAMGSLATALERINASQDPTQETTAVLDVGYLDLPANFVQMLRDMTENVKAMMVEGEYVVNTMTAEEVRKLTQMIRTLNHAIKEVSTLYANLRFANVEMLGDESMTFMDAIGEIQKTGGMKDFVQWENALPYYAFKRFGKGGESIFEGLMDAQDKLAFLAQKIFDFQEKAWTSKEAKKWSEDTHTIDLPDGEKLTLTTADAMSIYCLSRRQQGIQHLLGGGVRVVGIQKGSQKAKDSRSTLTIKDIDAIISSLTDRQKKVAESIQEFMSTTCSDWGNEISMKRFLTKEFNEKHYFPIESNDENLPTKDPSAQQSDLFRLLNISATKPIDPRANNEVIIRNIFDVFSGHASDMARLNAYGLPLLDYMKWLNYREKTVSENGQIKVRGVRKYMETAYGKAAKSYVLNLVKDVNGRPSDNGDPSILMKWMRTAKTASVGSSLRVATLQITSYPRAGLVLSPKSLALGLTKIPKIEKAKKYCGIALWKSFGFYDTNISRSIEEQMKGVKDVRQRLIELSLKGAEIGDAITWGAMWNACEYEVAATKKYNVGSEEFYEAVGKKLREVVYRTQVVDSTLTRSQMMRSKRGMAQEAAAFMSEPTLSANILMDAGMEFSLEKRRTNAKTAWKKTGKYISKAIAVYSIGQLTAALMEGLWDAWRDDDDEEFSEKYMSAFKENLAMDLIPFNKIPIVSDVFEAVLAVFDLGYYSSDKMATTWLTQAVSAADAWRDVLGGNSSVTTYSALYKTMRAISSFYGVSFSGVMREAVALWNNTAGAYDVTLKILTYDRSNAELGNLLLDAILEGDNRQANSLRAEFEDEDAYQSALCSTIKERYDAGEIDRNTATAYLVNFGGMEDEDAFWKVEEWEYENETGEDFGKYSEFFTAVETGKNLKTVIKKYTDNGVELKTLSSQITSHFKPIYGEMTASQRASIKGYLLNAFELCGVDREDATNKLQYWEFLGEQPDSELTQYQIADYYEFAKPAGISADLYTDYCRMVKNITGEGKKERRMAVIDSLPISNAQKDALYYAEGWAESKLYQAPWH